MALLCLNLMRGENNNLKVIKRDGRAVDYDRQKIIIAIGKANREVSEDETAQKYDIDKIIKYIESLNKKRILVEDIQDIIEQKLMELKKYNLAKKYIVYRYTRALVRKQNTTDETILGLIRNKNEENLNENIDKKLYLASVQRNYIAGEVSKDLTKRLLLPEKITKADKDGILYFHAAEYFIQPIFDGCIVDIEDMLKNGTEINGKRIESPKSFRVACILLTQIINAIACNQYGGQGLNISCLGKYARTSLKKYKEMLENKYKEKIKKDTLDEIAIDMLKEEIKSGVQTIFYQINTSNDIRGKIPNVTMLLYLDDNDKYIKENSIIIEEILKQKYEEVRSNHNDYVNFEFPQLVYVLSPNNNLSGGTYDYITRLAIKCTKNNAEIGYISEELMKNIYGSIFSPFGDGVLLPPWKDSNDRCKFEGRFNQGTITINLPQIALATDGNKDRFWKELDDRLEICKDALMCRHYALMETIPDISPIHWKNGAISRITTEKNINRYLKDGYSTLALGYLGIYEVSQIMEKKHQFDDTCYSFAKKLLEMLNNSINKWKSETGLEFILLGIADNTVGSKFVKIDKEKFGTINGITDKVYYTPSYQINVGQDNLENVYKKIELERRFQSMTNGGGALLINISDNMNDEYDIEKLIKYVSKNILYSNINIEKEKIDGKNKRKN